MYREEDEQNKTANPTVQRSSGTNTFEHQDHSQDSMENGGDEASSKRMQTDASSSTNDTPKPRAPRNCQRCRNHRLKITVKSHKRYCKYRFCECDRCKVTADKQRVTAMQAKLRRQLAQDEVKVRVADEVSSSLALFTSSERMYVGNVLLSTIAWNIGCSFLNELIIQCWIKRNSRARC